MRLTVILPLVIANTILFGCASSPSKNVTKTEYCVAKCHELKGQLAEAKTRNFQFSNAFENGAFKGALLGGVAALLVAQSSKDSSKKTRDKIIAGAIIGGLAGAAVQRLKKASADQEYADFTEAIIDGVNEEYLILDLAMTPASSLTSLHSSSFDVIRNSDDLDLQIEDLANLQKIVTEDVTVFSDIVEGVSLRVPEYINAIEKIKTTNDDIPRSFAKAELAVEKLESKLDEAKRILSMQATLLSSIGKEKSCRSERNEDDTHDPGPGCFSV